MPKLIGVIPLYDDEKQSLWMLPGYMDMLTSEGATPLMLPLTAERRILDEFLRLCGGFLFTGGHDVDPNIYGSERTFLCGKSCPVRDEMEGYLLDCCMQTDKPVLGICRGIQLINAHLGGTLYRDLPTEHPSKVEHHMSSPYDRAVHNVEIVKNTPLYDLLGVQELGVNSYHHQAVKALSPRLKPMAISEDGLIEAAYVPANSFIWAVQWHPEFSYQTDINSRKIVRAFVSAVK